jgi:RNA polymerase sigma-70 factor (ECF subfamily)
VTRTIGTHGLPSSWKLCSAHTTVRSRRTPAGASDAADDVVASTFLVAWRRVGEVPADSLPWLLAVARHVIATQRRTSRRQGALRSRMDAVGSAAAGPAAAEDPAGRVAHALAQLPESDREAITLIAWDGLRPAEAATVLGQSPATFRVRLHRAKRRLRRELERDGQADSHPQHHSVAIGDRP